MQLPIANFDYDLPQHLIAQTPSPQRDAARLMLVQRKTSEISHHRIHDLPKLLNSGDLLVLNNTQVLPARLYGQRERTSGKWEGLFLRQTDQGHWELLSQTRGALVPGEWVQIEGSPLRLRMLEKTPAGHWLVEPNESGSPQELLQRYGHVPLPPYIRQGRDQPEDHDRYQTVFASVPGAVAAPTAGLHFTPELLERLTLAGIRQSYVTLHVGEGTFQPIQADDALQHQMHEEWGELPQETVEAVQRARTQGGRVVAVGTTSVRVLESVAASGSVRPWTGNTNLYIHPPYDFKVVDALLTNFHLPRSSLLVLVSAFAGFELIRRAYRMAVEQEFRFYSYGDAMLIVDKWPLPSDE